MEGGGGVGVDGFLVVDDLMEVAGILAEARLGEFHFVDGAVAVAVEEIIETGLALGDVEEHGGLIDGGVAGESGGEDLGELSAFRFAHELDEFGLEFGGRRAAEKAGLEGFLAEVGEDFLDAVLEFGDDLFGGEPCAPGCGRGLLMRRRP